MFATSYAQFLQQATTNTIRATNQWEVELTSGYKDVDSVLRDVRLMVQGFTIPSRTVNYAEVSYKGYAAPLVPTNLEMQKEISFDVIEDVAGSYRRAFLAWMNHVIDANIEGGSVFQGERGVNSESIIRLDLFRANNRDVSQTYKFYNVRIKTVGETSLTYEGGDTAKFPVTFTCTYWTLEHVHEGELKRIR